MRKSLWIIRILVVVAFLGLPRAASADTLTTYTVQGVITGAYSGKVTGQFTYDSTSQAISDGYSGVTLIANLPGHSARPETFVFGLGNATYLSTNSNTSPDELTIFFTQSIIVPDSQSNMIIETPSVALY